MKHKHYLGILFAFLTIISFFNVFSRNYIDHYYEITAYASGVDNITARADYLYNLTWTAQASISGWDGYFYYGNTYHLPYGQPYNNSGYIYWDVSIDTFLDSTKDAGSIFYSQCSNNGAPYYAIDCSAFASYCWDLPRRTTTYHWADLDVTSYGKCNWDNIGNIQQGDALNLSDSHVVIISRVNSDGTYEVTEQTPPQIKRRNRTASQLISEFGNYTIYRNNNRENVSAPPNIKGMNIGNDFYAVLGTSETWAILGNNNGNVEIVKETGGAYNVWRFIRCSDNSYVIYNCFDNKVIDAHNAIEGSNVDVTTFSDTDSQHWYIYSNGNGAVYLQPKNTSNVLDVTSSSSEIGTNVQLYRYNGTNAQHFTIYQVDKADSGNLYIDAGNTISDTKFWWDKGTACTIYNLRIEKGEPGNTSSYLDKWNLSDTECTVKLPEGYYEAYVDFCNGYSVSMGRKMQFYVSTPVAGSSTISVSPGNKTSPTQFYWTETENTTIYNLRILSVQDGIYKSYTINERS